MNLGSLIPTDLLKRCGRPVVQHRVGAALGTPAELGVTATAGLMRVAARCLTLSEALESMRHGSGEGAVVRLGASLLGECFGYPVHVLCTLRVTEAPWNGGLTWDASRFEDAPLRPP